VSANKQHIYCEELKLSSLTSFPYPFLAKLDPYGIYFILSQLGQKYDDKKQSYGEDNKGASTFEWLDW